MSSSLSSFRVVRFVWCVAALVCLLAVLSHAGEQAADVSEPALTVESAETAASAKATPAEKSTEPTPASKAAEAEKKPASAEVRDSDASEPEKRSDNSGSATPAATGESEKKPGEAGTAKKASPPKPKTIGEPLSAGMIKLMQDEIVAGINKRGISDRFARFQSYASGKVHASSGKYTGSELTGNCRLRWYEHLMKNMLAAPAEAEQFTRDVHTAAVDEQDGLARVLTIAGEKMDVGRRKPRKTNVASGEQALDAVKQALTEAQVAYCAALAPLTKSEIAELRSYLVPILSTQNQVGHTLNDRGTGRRLCDLMEKMDRASLHVAAEALAPLSNVRLLEQLKTLPADGNLRVPGVTGAVAAKIETPSGTIIVGGKAPNTYQLDQMRDVAAVIDLGGNNVYYEGTVGTNRPVLVVINLDGNNSFSGSQAGIQGGAVLGISMLVNFGGNNSYEAADVAQGSALAGVGILVDRGGNNRYRGIRRVQGQAIGGLGILISGGGKNDYHAAMWAQGFGGPLGFGMLDSLTGNNHYYCGGMWRDSYPETPGLEGWGQGVGAGLRQVANGGIGIILDGGGENVYEFDYLSHGGGYWCGLGFARDFGGNTQRLITRAAYDGGARREPSFQRFGCGWGCHYSLGFCFDDGGDNVYEGTIMGTGMAWDCSVGVLADFGRGNNRYTATGGLTQGTGAQMGFGILFHYDGDDVYEGYGQGYASQSLSYHPLPACGGNFGFVIDYGGKDKYGCGAENNSYIQRGDAGGFVIDRPRRDEVQPTAATAAPTTTAESAPTSEKPKDRRTTVVRTGKTNSH